jgi:hypothetical protein
MIKIYSNQNSVIVYNLKNVLEDYSIQCEVRNDIIGRLMNVPNEAWVELWITDDNDFDAAIKIVDDALSDDEEISDPSWMCPNCGEENVSQFTECWSCNHSRL